MKAKKLGLLILLIFFFSNLSAALITHLKFEDNFEDSYGDINGIGVNGTIFSTGIEGRGAYFDGSDDYIDLGDANYRSNGEFNPRGAGNSYSISMWVESTQVASSSNNNCYIGKHTGSGGNVFLFGYFSNALKIQINSSYTTVSSVSEPQAWVHYVVTAKESSGSTSLKVYKDGALFWTGSLNNVFSTFSTSDKPWVLGQDWDSSTSDTDHFKGYMDNVRFYDTEIDANYVHQIYLKESSLAHYTFDDTLEDSGTNGYDGTQPGGAGFDFGLENRAISLDGSNDSYVELGNFDPRDSSSVNDFSISMWVKSDVQATSSNNNCYIGKHTSSGGNIFLFGYWGGALKVQIKNQVATVTTVAEPTEWTHYVIVGYENDTVNKTELTVYKNGEELWVGTLNDRMGEITGAGHKRWVVGQDWDTDSNNQPYPTDFLDGKVDNVRFYDRQMSLLYADKVQQLYRSEFSGLRYCNAGQDSSCTIEKETVFDLSQRQWLVQSGQYLVPVGHYSIESIRVSEGWEAYLCPSTNNQGTCHYFDDGDYASGGELPSALVNSTYSITVQPKTFDAAKKYFGYKKVEESGNLPVGFAYFYQYPDYEKPTKANDFRRLFMDSENRRDFQNMSVTILGSNRTSGTELFGNVYAILSDNYYNDKYLMTSHRYFNENWSYYNYYPSFDFRDYNDNVKQIWLVGRSQEVGSVGWFFANDLLPEIDYVCLDGIDQNLSEEDYVRAECTKYGTDYFAFEQSVSDDEFYERIYGGNKHKFEKYADNYDLLMFNSHGDFYNGTFPEAFVTMPYSGYGHSVHFTANESWQYSKMLGKLNTKWVELVSCNSMGKDGVENWSDVGDAYYNILTRLNGVGGFRNPEYVDTGTYETFTYDYHWDELLRSNKTISDAWVSAWSESGSFYDYDYDCWIERDARFLTLENCNCTLSSCTSYMKNDYFYNVQTGPMPQKTTLTGYNYYCFRDRESPEFRSYTRSAMMLSQEETYPEEFAAYTVYSVPDNVLEKIAGVEIGGKETKIKSKDEYTYKDEWVKVRKKGKDVNIIMNRKLESFEYGEDWEYTAKDKFEEAKAIVESLTTLDIEYAGVAKDVNEAFEVDGNGESLGKQVNSISFVFRPKIDGLSVFIEDITVDYDAGGLYKIKSRAPYSIILSRKGNIKTKDEAIAEMAEKVKIEEAENGKIMYTLDKNYELSLSYMTKDEEKKELKTISLEAKDE